MNAKLGSDVTELDCKKVQVGSATLSDGTVQPIFQIEPCTPLAYRRLIAIVTNEGRGIPSSIR